MKAAPLLTLAVLPGLLAAPAWADAPDASATVSTASATATTTTAPLSADGAAALDQIAASATPDLSNYAWRHNELTLHQGFGIATLGAMALTAGLGYYGMNVKPSFNTTQSHLLMAGLTTGLYLTTATLALTAPPKPVQEETGFWDTSSLHKNLAWLHGAAMLATVGLGLLTAFDSYQFAPYHEAAGFTTLGLMTLSAGVIAFGD